MWPSDRELEKIIGVVSADFDEDIAQDVMVVLGRAIEDGQTWEDGKLFPWCYGVAIKRQFQAWAKAKRRGEILFDPWTSTKLTDHLLHERDIDPAFLYECREVLEAFPVAMLEDTPLSGPNEGKEKRQEPLTKSEANRRSLRRQEVRKRFGL